ncbi:ribosome recycling factor [bacterium]|nr:ribosome recycling factor [bacterium]
MNEYLSEKQEDFAKAVEFFKKDISSIRTGRANPAVLDSVVVDAYDIKNKIQAVANVSVMDSKTISVTPWDKSVLKSIEKAITEANLGLSIQNEGDKLLLVLPKMTEENRKDYVKTLNDKHEKSRITIRQVRDDVKTAIEEAEEAKDISEDEKFMYMKELEAEVSKYNDELKAICDKKEQDIMTV